MGVSYDHLMADVRRLTACRTECPKCGHIGMATWTREEDVCRCRTCGTKFHFKANTYRPLTRGMTQADRTRFYRRGQPKVKSDYSPAEWERQRVLRRERQRRYRERKKRGLV